MRIILFVQFALLSAYTIAYADHNEGNNNRLGNAGRSNQLGNEGLDNTQTGDAAGAGVRIENPLAADNLTEFFLLIIEILLIFAVPVIVFFIILAGFKFVTAQGNDSALAEAKKALLYAIIGGLLILGAFIILEVIQGTVASFQANP